MLNFTLKLENPTAMKRRTFMKKSIQSGIALSSIPLLSNCGESKPGTLPKRALGKTGEKLSIIGFGGVVVMNEEPEEAANRVARWPICP